MSGSIDAITDRDRIAMRTGLSVDREELRLTASFRFFLVAVITGLLIYKFRFTGCAGLCPGCWSPHEPHNHSNSLDAPGKCRPSTEPLRRIT
jgi:hypothetical protein